LVDVYKITLAQSVFVIIPSSTFLAQEYNIALDAYNFVYISANLAYII